MKRFKQFVLFAVLGILFIIFSEFMIRVGLRNLYKTISGEIKTSSPQIIVTEAKTTEVNGYVVGKVKNNSEQEIEKATILIELYSRRDIKLGEEHLEIKDLNSNEERDFEIKYKYSKVDHYIITCTVKAD